MKNQPEDHEQHESVEQTLARYEQRIAELEAMNESLDERYEAAQDRFKAVHNKSWAAKKRIAELEDILRDVWEQFAYVMPDGTRSDGGLSTLELVKAALGGDDET